jgi:hypothetical protein
VPEAQNPTPPVFGKLPTHGLLACKVSQVLVMMLLPAMWELKSVPRTTLLQPPAMEDLSASMRLKQPPAMLLKTAVAPIVLAQPPSIDEWLALTVEASPPAITPKKQNNVFIAPCNNSLLPLNHLPHLTAILIGEGE